MEDVKSSESFKSINTELNSTAQVLKRFIELYETLPELWNIASPLYFNKYKKCEGYKKMLEIYKEIKPQAKVIDVKKQLNTLRSNYRREVIRIKASKLSGCGEDNVYKPTSWKYYALSFLEKIISPDISSDKNKQPRSSSDVKQQGPSQKCQTALSSLTPNVKQQGPTQKCQTALSSITPKQPPLKKTKTVVSTTKQKKLFISPYNQLSTNNKLTSTAQLDDEYLNIAKVWANKLKNLHPIQKKLAEKAVNDILFEADMGTLNRGSVRINCIKEDTDSEGVRPF